MGIPISFVVPRKSGGDVFQEDIYPDCYAGKPALSADEWLDGNNKDPIYTSMDPEKQENGDEQENKTLKARIKELEAQIGGGAADQNEADEEKEQWEQILYIYFSCFFSFVIN